MSRITAKTTRMLAIRGCVVIEAALITRDPVDGGELPTPYIEVSIPAGRVLITEHDVEEVAAFLSAVAADSTLSRYRALRDAGVMPAA